MRLQFAELPVEDQDRAKSFFLDILGFDLVADVPMSADGWRWIEVKSPGTETAVHFLRRSGPAGDEPALVFVVDDVPAKTAELGQQGATILTQPSVTPYDPGRTYSEILDSEGNRLMLSS